jgi:hypothetical protein
MFSAVPIPPAEFQETDLISMTNGDKLLFNIISNYVCFLLSKSIPGPIQERIQKSETCVHCRLSLCGSKQKEDIFYFFRFVHHHGKLTFGEVIYIFYLFDRFLENDCKLGHCGKPPTISQENLGTLLICCLMIALKMTRDSPLKNVWYSNKFEIPLPVLVEGELIVLERLEFNCLLTDKKYHQFCQHFLPLITQPESAS